MNFYNRVLDKKGLKRIVSWFIENYGPTRTSVLLDDFKYLGFHYAGQAGLSLGFDDLRIPPTKKLLLDSAQKQVQDCEKTYIMGRITAFERYQKLIDIWTTTSEKLKDDVIQNFEKIQGGPLASPLYMMAFSGARGNISQVRQLVGMRGLMSDSGGGIIDFPIRSNFREGLSVTEYVISCYGARKGLIDTALRTADSGYLTRRLVDVAHGIIIREIDCGSLESISMRISDIKNLVGRVLAETVQGGSGGAPAPSTSSKFTNSSTLFREKAPELPEFKNRILWRNQEISLSIALELKSLKGHDRRSASVQVRSPLTCLSQSVCQLCYGWNLAQGRLVSLGDAVGILAAQSIGEPGTQLTMRTFHTGGIFSTEVEDKLYSPQDGSIFLQKRDRAGAKPPRGSAVSETNFLDFLEFPQSQGCKIRSVHGQTAFFFFDSIQLKIKSQTPLSGGYRDRTFGGPSVEDLSSVRPAFTLSENQTLEGNHPPKVQEGASPPRSPQESILQLPAQSILFVSPGKYISKNSLFAEISRIKQPREKIQEIPGGPNRTGQSPSKIKNEKFKKDNSSHVSGRIETPGGKLVPDLSVQKAAVSVAPQTSDRRFGGGEAPPLGSNLPTEGAAPQKKVFSEIQGEVIEKSIGGSCTPSPPKTFTPLSNFKKTSRLRPTAFEPDPSAGVKFSQTTRKLKESTQTGATPDSPPLIKSRIVLAAEPFIFKRHPPGGRPKVSQALKGIVRKTGVDGTLPNSIIGSPQPSGRGPSSYLLNSPKRKQSARTLGCQASLSFQGKETENSLFNLDSKKMELPFRMGDVVFWKGKRKLNNQKGADLLKNKSPLRSGGSPLGLRWEIEPERAKSPQPIQAFEIRRIEKGPTGRSGGGSPPPPPNPPSAGSFTTISSLRSLNPSLSGLILLFEQQKQKTVNISRLEGRTSGGDLLGPSPLKSFGRQKLQIGKIIPPHIAFNYFKTDLKVKIEGQEGRGEKRSGVPDALNLPTQIIRKRSDKLILRRVQPHLGGENIVVENKHLTDQLRSEEVSSKIPKEGRPFDGDQGGAWPSPVPSPKPSVPTRYVKERDLLFHLVLPISQSSSSSDIVQGLPKIEQLFEARSKNENVGPLMGPGGTGPRLGVSLLKTELRNLQKRLIQEIQAVYNSQGVEIADKHLEIIVRQMTSRIRILEKGNTPFFPEDIVEFFGKQEIGLSNEKTMLEGQGSLNGEKSKAENFMRGAPDLRAPEAFLEKENRAPKNVQSLTEIPAYEWVLLGITKVALLATTESYISAASFQETKRVLMSSALQSRVDFFEGLKENVIVGRIIPAGTGYQNS